MEPAVDVRDLHFAYRRGQREVLKGVELRLEPGMRCLLAGANGAGKTTLLRVLAGKHMVPRETVRVLGSDAFHDTSLADRVELLGGLFPFDVDVEVSSLVNGVRGVDPRRRQELIELLGVDLCWHMHAVSDGQRRRVQILLGLLRPSRLLLLDEVTTDLDLLARQDLLEFLRREADTEKATILYATHIFDALDDWATHLAYMHDGRVTLMSELGQVPEWAELRGKGVSSPLLRLIDRWLRRDRAALG